MYTTKTSYFYNCTILYEQYNSTLSTHLPYATTKRPNLI